MSFITFWKATEADVVKAFVAIQSAEQVAAKDINKALAWVAGNSDSIMADLGVVQSVAVGLGLGGNPEVTASVAVASVAAQEFIKFATAYTAGQSTAATLTTGYQAYTATKAAVSSALATAAAAPAKPAVK